MFHQKYVLAPHYIIFSVVYCTTIGHMIASIPCFQWVGVCRSIARAILKIVLMALLATQFWWCAFVPQTKFVHYSHGFNKSTCMVNKYTTSNLFPWCCFPKQAEDIPFRSDSKWSTNVVFLASSLINNFHGSVM